MSNKNTLKIFIAVLLVLSSIQMIYASGDKRNGTGGAQELLIPVGARGLSLAGSDIGGIKGLDAVYYNPAGLSASTHSTEATFSYMNYIADINFLYAGVGVNLSNFGSMAFTIRSLDFGDIPETTVDSPYGTGATFSPTFVTVGLTYSNHLTDRIKVGVTANLITEKIMSVGATGIAFDAGVQYDGLGMINGLKFGVVLRNFGPQMRFNGADLLRKATETNAKRGEQFYQLDAAAFELPSQLELGLSYSKNIAENITTMVSSSFTNNNFSNDEYKLGAEVGFKNMFFLRGGYIYTREGANNADERLFGPVMGAGFNLGRNNNITLNYAYRWVRLFDDNQVFSLTIAF